jgi:hypothetical protein
MWLGESLCPSKDEYYLVTANSFSALHLILQDEIFHFYYGSPVEMLQITDDRHVTIVEIGSDILPGQVPQVVAPKGVWQGTRIKNPTKNSFALMGTTVAPGFEFEDFKLASRSEFIARFSQYESLIRKFTHEEVK